MSLDSGEFQYAVLDGARVRYKNFGKGREALVFVHGWTCSLEFWDQQIPAFVGRTRVIAIDLPGHGGSDKPNLKYDMDLFARSIDAVLKHAGVERAVIAGHSMGTPVARQFYRKYPGKTLGLIFVDGPLRSFGDRKRSDAFIDQLRGAGFKENASRFIDMMLGPGITATMKERIKSTMLATPQAVAVSAMEGMADESIWTSDPIKVPVLMVLNKNGGWPADTEQFTKSLASDLDFQVWDGVGHFLMMEKPGEFNAAVVGFLDKHKLLKK